MDEALSSDAKDLEARLKEFYEDLTRLATAGDDPDPTPTPTPVPPTPTPIPTPPPKDEGLDKQLADKDVQDKALQDMHLTLLAQANANQVSVDALARQVSSSSSLLQRAIASGGVPHTINRASRPDVVISSFARESDLRGEGLTALQQRFSDLMIEISDAVRGSQLRGS